MDRGGGRQRLREPLLPTGTNIIDTIVEENFAENFDNYLSAEHGQFNTTQGNTVQNQNLDFTTSTSSVSTGSFVESTLSDNSEPIMSHSGSSFSGSGQYHQSYLASGSSNSFHGSGSLHGYTPYASPGRHHEVNQEIGVPFGMQNAPGFIGDKNKLNTCIGSGVLSEISDFSTTSEEENDPLKDIEPSIHLDPNFDVSDYLHTLQVEFIQIKDRIFEKQQSRKDKKARQRIVDGKVKISVTSDKPVGELKVWVRREPQAATLCNDKNGDVELKKPTLLRHTHNQWLYVVDLDSVYQGVERPVYELAKVEMNERNMFELLAQVLFQNGETSEKVTSKSFLIRTLKRSYQDDGQKNRNKWTIPKKMTAMCITTMLCEPQILRFNNS